MKKVGGTSRPYRYDLEQIPYDYTVEVMDRFEGLYLVERVPEELWMEICNTVQGQVTKTIPKKCKMAQWLSEEGLQIAQERREVKGKGEMERYTQMNAEVQRTARKDKKPFLSEQCKEIEENIRMGKTRGLFEKLGETKGTFHERWA